MPRRKPQIRWNEIDPHRLPDVVSEGVALVLLLVQDGTWERISKRLQITRRADGYNALDAILLLLYYYTSPTSEGVRTYYKLLAPYKRPLAALALRDELAAPSSLSRTLRCIGPGELREELTWLLSEAADIDVVLRHPAMMTYDSTGQGWHVFDHDGSVTTLRHRALPLGEDYPEPVRRSEQMKPGYSGRKRGDVQYMRATMQHAGSSCWLYENILPGNGSAHQQLEESLSVVVSTCQRIGHPTCRSMIRLDGQYGSVPFYTACQEKGVGFVSRLNRAELFEQASIRRRLREGVWHFVPDSGSGPRRSALSLGEMTLSAGVQTRRPDGLAYEPVVVRVVVCRYEKTGKKNHGVLVDGWQYELFATSLPQDGFSAAAVVAGYFARACIENRFSQEDREAGLDRIVSYHLPGQEFACAIGLFVWNMRVVQGFRRDPPPEHPPTQTPDNTVVDERPCLLPLLPSEQTPEQAIGQTPTPPTQTDRQTQTQLRTLLAGLPWPVLLAKCAGWSLLPTGELMCKEGRTLHLSTIRAVPDVVGRMALIFCRPAGGCQNCVHRAGCMRSANPDAGKHKELYVEEQAGIALKAALVRCRQPGERADKSPISDEPAVVSASPSPPASSQTYRYAVHTSLFLPAVARRRWREEARSLTVRVLLTESAQIQPQPVLLAVDEADRQHRRKTWKQHVDYYALKEGVHVVMDMTGSSYVRGLLQPSPQQAAA